MDQDSSSQSQSISKDDPLGKAFGKEHPERVRGLGFGPFPSKVFNNTSSSSNDNQMKEYVANLEKELAATKAQLQVQNDVQKAMYPMKEANTNLHKGVERNIHPLVIMLMDNLLHDYYNIFQWRQLLPDEGSKHQSSQGSGKKYSSSSHHVNGHLLHDYYNIFSMEAIDPWWNPAVEEQAIMRIHRIGQKRTVCVRRFIVKETVEERMQQVLRLKTEDDARALTDYEVRSTRIEELKMLFR
nr:DNA repair protein RAD5B [Ipomoea batatas]